MLLCQLTRHRLILTLSRHLLLHLRMVLLTRPYRGGFAPGENWLAGWSAADEFGFLTGASSDCGTCRVMQWMVWLVFDLTRFLETGMRRLIRTFVAYILAFGCTAFFFMLLPLLQAINSPFQGLVSRAMESLASHHLHHPRWMNRTSRSRNSNQNHPDGIHRTVGHQPVRGNAQSRLR